MSVRLSSVPTDKDHIAKAFMRSFIEVIENFIDENAHLDVVFKCVMAFYNSMNDENRSLILKKILMHFLRKFPVEFDELEKADEYIQKTLELWRIFGRCSKTMGPVAILEKIEDTYAGCWQYYRMYAESLIEEGRTDTDQLYKTFKNCVEHCDLSNDEVRKIFGPRIMSYVKFPEISDEDECTIQFMQIRQNDIRKSLAARRRSSLAPNRLQAILESQEPVSERPTITKRCKSPPAADTYVEQSTMLVRKPPVDDFTVFKDPTIVTEQRKPPVIDLTEQPSTTLNRKSPVDDFTVFKDPTIVAGQRRSFDANANSPTVCGNHLIPKKMINGAEPFATSTPDHLRKPVILKFDS